MEVGIIRYGGGVLDWTKEELKSKSKHQILHAIVGRHIHWLLLKNHGVPADNKW